MNSNCSVAIFHDALQCIVVKEKIYSYDVYEAQYQIVKAMAPGSRLQALGRGQYTHVKMY